MLRQKKGWVNAKDFQHMKFSVTPIQLPARRFLSIWEVEKVHIPLKCLSTLTRSTLT